MTWKSKNIGKTWIYKKEMIYIYRRAPPQPPQPLFPRVHGAGFVHNGISIRPPPRRRCVWCEIWLREWCHKIFPSSVFSFFIIFFNEQGWVGGVEFGWFQYVRVQVLFDIEIGKTILHEEYEEDEEDGRRNA